MRAASLLLVATLFTTSVVSGTYAKYVTSDSHTDIARVAKFGVVATVSGELFAKSYLNEEADYNERTRWVDSSSNVPGYITVNADKNYGQSVADNIVAPGTQNSDGLMISLSGKPEVETKITLGNAEGAANYESGYYYSSDIMLKAGNYGVMVKCDQNIPGDFFAKMNEETAYMGYSVPVYFYKNVDGCYSPLTDWISLEDAGSVDGYVYKLIDVSNSIYESDIDYPDRDYYPIEWKITSKNSDRVGVSGNNSYTFEEIKYTWELWNTLQYQFYDGYTDNYNSNQGISSFGEFRKDNGKSYFIANADVDLGHLFGSAQLTWEWPFRDDYGEAGQWTEADSNKDTILGDLIYKALDDYYGTANDMGEWSNNREVVKLDMSYNRETRSYECGVCYPIKITRMKAQSRYPSGYPGNALGLNDVYVAYYDDGSNSSLDPYYLLDSKLCAVLTECFAGQLTVEQVD